MSGIKELQLSILGKILETKGLPVKYSVRRAIGRSVLAKWLGISGWLAKH
jgi:hypothetical protein